jgi:hypothetical protein
MSWTTHILAQIRLLVPGKVVRAQPDMFVLATI